MKLLTLPYIKFLQMILGIKKTKVRKPCAFPGEKDFPVENWEVTKTK
jgi:hypothetical protein